MDKLKFIKVTAFVADEARVNPLGYLSAGYNIGSTGAVELYLPIDSISHLSKSIHNDDVFDVHIKKNFPLNLPFGIKSFNPVRLTTQQLEFLG